MTRLPLSIALAIVAVLPALGEDVPFAAPPPPNLGQSSTYLASLGDIMGKIQLRHIKLWYAIKSKNWDLLDYELGQIRDSFETAVILYRNIPVGFINSANKPLIALQEAVKSKDGAKLERGFADLTTACNNCHKAARVGFFFTEGYHHLTYEERCQIYALMQSGLSQAAIARQLSVHRSTIKRELDRNTGARSYRFNRRRRRRRKNEKQPRVRHAR